MTEMKNGGPDGDLVVRAPTNHVNDSAGQGGTLQVAAERMHVRTRCVETGRVRVGTTTRTVDLLVPLDVVSAHAQVTRVPVGRILAPGETPPVSRTEGNVTIVPVLEEVLVVETRLRLTEEIRVLTSKTTQEVEIPVTLRHQTASVERVTTDPTDDPNTPNDSTQE